MTAEEIDKIIAGLEYNRVEFKVDLSGTEEQNRKHHVMRSVTAFYNTKGGLIIFGLRDKTGELVGVIDPQQLEHSFMQQLHGLVPDIDVSPETEIVEYKSSRLLVVRCPKGHRPPYVINGYTKPFVRVGSSNVEASDDQIAQMYRDRSPEPQDRLAIETAKIDDLDLQAVENYLKSTSIYEGDRKDVVGYLVREGLAQIKADGVPSPTYAGILLFGKNPQTFLPHAIIKADVKMREDQDGWDDLQTFGGTVFEQLRAAESFMKRSIPTAAKIVGFRRVELSAIPPEALREGIVNAVVHRDYRDSGAEIHLRIRGSGVSVINPGGLLPPLTIEIVMGGAFAPRSRNATIAEALVRLGGFMEKRGSGIDRMRRMMRAAQLPEPEFKEEGGAFYVLFRASLGSPTAKRDAVAPISDSELGRLNLSEDHFKILELIEEKTEVRPGEIADALKRSRPFVNDRLNELLEKEVVARTTENKQDPNVKYKIHPRFFENRSNKPGPTQQAKLL